VNWRRLALVIVVVAFVAVVVYYVRKSSSLPAGYQYEERATEEVAPAPSVTTEQVRAVGAKTAVGVVPRDVEADAEEERFIYSSKDVRNPMTPLLAKLDKSATGTGDTRRPARVAVTHRLEGIMWSVSKPLAIIDGNVMGVGEKLRDGSIVTEIGRNFVALKRGGKTFRLVLE
jgi:hypothetical protein